MKIVDELEVVSVEDDGSEACPQAIIAKKSDASCQVRLHGDHIVKQLLLDNGWYLVFLLDGNVYEETLRVFLLDQNLKTLDGIEFGAAYVSGTFEEFKIHNKFSVSFKFVHVETCVIELNESAQIEAPLLKKGVRRIGWNIRRYLKPRWQT